MSGKAARLPGMRDVVGSEYERTDDAARRIASFLRDRGYQVIDTPVLEETELFAMKSGAELTSRLYTFTDPSGHRVSLRPEFTSSVIRHFIQERDFVTVPARWQYHGPVFRYERGESSRYRQFTQVGAELIGAGGVGADAEIISMAWSVLRETGLKCQMRVGHLGVLNEFLSGFDLSEAAKLFLVRNVQSLRDGRSNGLVLQRAEAAGLFRPSRVSTERDNGADSGEELTGESVKRLFEDELSKPYGRRTVGDIVGRLVRQSRAADHPGEIVRASALLAELATVRGKSNDALDRARQVARSHGLGPESIELVERLVDGLQAHPLESDSIVFDFGLARDFSYYTGVIFEAHVIGGAEGQALGGGGRYDGLIQSLGGEDIPALGFAFTMEMVAEALQRSNEQPDGAPARREL